MQKVFYKFTSPSDVGDKMQGMKHSGHLYLTGFRGTGKTSVGAILGKTLAREVIDLDHVVVEKAGQSIGEIFAEGGESRFRDLESTALQMVVQEPDSVVSLGGGAILREENRRLIRETGTCFWLDADAETIANRIQGDTSTAAQRPALTTLGELEEIRELLKKRHQWYEDVSGCRIDTSGKSLEQVADEILRSVYCDSGSSR